MSNEIITQQTLTLESDSLLRARAIVIASNEDYAAADAFSVGLLTIEKAIKSDFKDAKDKAFAAHRAIVAQEAGHLEKVQEARAMIRPKLQAWETIMKKKAEDERLRREAEARREAEDRALAEAAQAEKAGDKATAQAIISAPVQVEAVVVAPVLPKRQTRIPEAWTFHITNEALIPREYLCADAMKLSGVARATKGSIQVAGVRFYDKNKA